VYKKTVRRRRAALAALVALSLLLLTAYFGERSGGPLHSLQRGFLTVVAPVESGANAVLSPFRSAFKSIGNAFSTGARRAALERQNAKLRAQLIAYQSEAQALREASGIGRADAKFALSNYRPVSAQVIADSPTIWYETVVIDQGTSAGIADNDPVINGEGLIGKVALAYPDGALVMLITDHEMAVSAKLAGRAEHGIIKPKVGSPDDLQLEYLPQEAVVNPGEYVVTAGSIAQPGESLYPPGIPIGEVTAAGSMTSAASVRPLVNLHALGTVQVLTTVNGSPPARLTNLLQRVAFARGAREGAFAGASPVGSEGEG
jgi:rod shape-determining protein MreC